MHDLKKNVHARKQVNRDLIAPLCNSQTGWHRRGFLPHLDRGERTQFITIRQFDSLPQSHLQYLRDSSDSAHYQKIQAQLDSGLGSCLLRSNQVASIVKNSLYFLSDKKFSLHEWVIMPNHLHLLITLEPGQSLANIMQSFKSFTSRTINKTTGNKGSFWYPDYYDRYIRDRTHFENTKNYIRLNPVIAGLCPCPDKWHFSSAYKTAE